MAVLPAKFTELGRIRTGDKVAVKGKNGVSRPHRLETFRLTSVNKPRLECAAKLYGGTVTEWPEAPQGKQFQLYTEAEAISVTVPPYSAFSQYNEIWAGEECRLRCDGEFVIKCHDQVKMGHECFCAKYPLAERLERAKTGTACHTVTRVSLIIPDLPGIGVWRFDTNSYYAGMELQGITSLLEQAAQEGTYIECTLQIEQRKVVRRTKEGKVQTQVFPVVTLQPNVSMRQLVSRNIPEHALISGPAKKVPSNAEMQRLIEETCGDDMPGTQRLITLPEEGPPTFDVSATPMPDDDDLPWPTTTDEAPEQATNRATGEE